MLQIQCLQSKKLEVNSLFSRFAIGPFKKGQGLTIGNSLRRILLSDLPGSAITGIRIADVSHEFSTIPSIKEDVIDILLNLKQIVLKGYVKDPILTRLEYCGPGIITAKDIQLPDELTLVEPNQYIAMVTTNRIVEMEILIKSGEGYSINNLSNSVPEGFLPIDAVYMPVTKVNYFIETSNKETSSNNSESLILEVYTNGSITPSEAVTAAAEILQAIFKCLNVTDSPIQSLSSFDKETKKENTVSFENVLIEELELSVRAFNCLKRANIHTLSDLLKYSQDELLEFKNFGQKSAEEVYLSLKKKFGKTLR